MKMNRLILYITSALIGFGTLPLPARSEVRLNSLAGRIGDLNLSQNTPEASVSVEKDLFIIEGQLVSQDYAFALQNSTILLNTLAPGRNQSKAELFQAIARSALHLPGAAQTLKLFLEKYPYHIESNAALWALARNFFAQQEYELANTYFLQTDPGKWSGETLNTFRFEAAYAAMQCKDYDRASDLFFSLTRISNPRQNEALYYYSYIAFLRQMYAVALKGFRQIREIEPYTDKVPFYIYSIYYKRGQLDSLLSIPESDFAKMNGNTRAEMARMIGEAYYIKNEEGKAFKYFEEYLAHSSNISDDDRLMIGLCAYRSKAYLKCIDILSELPSEQTSVSQYGLYYLGFAFMKQKDDHNAAQAFLLASQQTTSAEIAEESAFNYAKMRLKMTRNPFNEDISSLQDFLTRYPNSTHRSEINSYLMAAYSNSQNYAQAMRYMNAIPQPTEEQLKIKQKLSYLYAVDLLSKGKTDSAILACNQCIGYSVFDPSMARDAKFWKAEALFKQNNFAAAQILLEDFLVSDGVKNSAYYTPAMYSQAYCQFHLKKYNEALLTFQSFLKITPHKGDQAADACLRMGDCCFMQKKYARAIEIYREAYAYKSKDADYCLYQQGFCFGLLDKPKEKIIQLSALIKDYPASSYRDNALFERGRTYILTGNAQAGKKDFEQLVQQYAKGALTARAMVELGLIAMNEDRKEDAMEMYKKIVSQYPGTPEARNALLGVKNIYIGQSDIDSYFKYVENLGLYSGNHKEEKDTLTYAVAENLYLENNCARAVPAFEKYLQEFPQGKFYVEASYYAGDCAYRSQSYAKAYQMLSGLFNRPNNSFSEQAFIMAARSADQLNNASWIKEAYSRLISSTEKADLQEEAELALLKLAVAAKDTAQMITLGSSLIKRQHEPALLPGLSARACAFGMQKKVSEQIKDLDELIKYPKSPQGAQACYLRAQIYFDAADYSHLEKTVFALAESGSTQEFWMAKCFILLGNAYRLQNDFFQARATIQSVLNGYKQTEDSIHSEAQEALNLINQAEETHRKTAQ